MSAKKQTSKPAGATDDLSFEQAIARLETIVADMESTELPLEDVLERYAEGTRLVRFCGEKLEEAEKKIEVLSKKSDGGIERKPLDEPGAHAAAANHDDDDQVGDLF